MRDFISAHERKRLKNKLLIRNFIILPIALSLSLHLYGSLMRSEFVDLNVMLLTGSTALIVVTILWILTNTDNNIRKEKRMEIKKKHKSKKRIAVEYILIALCFIVVALYAWQY